MALEFKIKRGDQFPPITIRIKDKKTGGNFDLSGGSATFSMKDKDDNVVIDTESATIESPPTDGRVTYSWSGTDTDIAGRFRGEFELTGVTLAGGKKFSAPQSGFVEVFIEQDVNNT